MALPFRQIHMDFHTSPLIGDVGTAFDPDEFADMLRAAHVNSVTCFAKCHHGMSYYPTEVGVRHPSLQGDMLGAQIEACHRRGLNVPVYISVVWDEDAAAKHADWLQVAPDGKLAGRPPFGDRGWRYLCLNSPYLDYVAAQTEEVVRRYPVDGIFFDIVMEVEPGCVCNHCLRTMAEAGLDPLSEADLRHKARVVAGRAMERLSSLVHAHRPQATVFYNSRLRLAASPSIGSRPELPYMTHVEIESLPSGGWGYNHFPLFALYFQQFDRPLLGMTARFHKTWADFGGLKSLAALEYECFRMLAAGAACSVGDQLHPRGRLEAPVYQRIAQVYAEVERYEPWVVDSVPQVDVGVLLTTGLDDGQGRSSASDEGVLRMLLESHHQFAFVDPDAELGRFKVLIAPDVIRFDEELARRIREYLHQGGKLILSYHSGLSPEAAHETSRFALEELGVQYDGESEYTPAYLRLSTEWAVGASSLPVIDHVLYDQGAAVSAAEGAKELAGIVRPYFNRTWQHFSSHNQTPPDVPAGTAGVVHNRSVIYFSHPLFRMYHTHGYALYRDLITAALELLLPQPLLRATLPTSAEATLRRQHERHVLHLLHYAPQRRALNLDLVEDRLPLGPTTISIRVPRAPARAFLAPDGPDLPVSVTGGYASVELPAVAGHAVVVLE